MLIVMRMFNSFFVWTSTKVEIIVHNNRIVQYIHFYVPTCITTSRNHNQKICVLIKPHIYIVCGCFVFCHISYKYILYICDIRMVDIAVIVFYKIIIIPKRMFCDIGTSVEWRYFTRVSMRHVNYFLIDVFKSSFEMASEVGVHKEKTWVQMKPHIPYFSSICPEKKIKC